ncbi:MAG: hypothetical protein ACRDY7_02405 [Acidimicrobiia bacterium]
MREFEREFTETVTAGVPLDTLLDWSRSPESRLCWPGASDVRRQGSTLYFRLNMQAPGAPPASGTMEEELWGVARSDGGDATFKSQLQLTWPSGEVGSGEAGWAFRSDGDKTTLSFSIGYTIPKKFGVGRVNRDQFLHSIDRALSLYIQRLAHGPQASS